MAHIIVHRIEELARRRPAVAAQRAALPPQPARANLLLWDLDRVPWAHARSQRFTKYEARDAVAAAALAEDVPAAEIEALTLDEVIVLPDGTIEATIGGVRIVTRWPRVDPTKPPAPGEYEILQTGGIVSLEVSSPHPGHPNQTFTRSAVVPGPARLNAISIKWHGSADTTGLFSASMPGLGWRYSHLLVTGGAATQLNSVTIPLGFVIAAPQPLQLELGPVDGVPLADVGLNAWVSYNHARRSR